MMPESLEALTFQRLVLPLQEYYLQILSQPRADTMLNMAGTDAQTGDPKQGQTQLLPIASRSGSGTLRVVYEALVRI